MASNTTKNARQPPWGQDNDKESMGFGLWLRRQREMREVPLREVADVTKISLRYLEALEQERFDILPAPVFAKGFLREYSRYVGLDADEVVNSFLIATGEIVEDEEEEDLGAEATGGPKRAILFITLTAIVVVAVVAVVAWLQQSRAEQPIQSSPIAAPVTTSVESLPEEEPPAPVDEMLSPLTVTIDFTEDCWMEALIDGERTISELRVQGESVRLEAESTVLLTLGNPSGVSVEVNGHPYVFAQPEGRVVRNLAIDLPLAESLARGEN